MDFETVASQGRALCSRMKLPHFTCDTPMFLSVGTRGSVKGLTSQQLQDLDCHVECSQTRATSKWCPSSNSPKFAKRAWSFSRRPTAVECRLVTLLIVA